MNKTFDIPLDRKQQTASALHRIRFTDAQRAIIKKACGASYTLWESRKTGMEAQMPFLIGWSTEGGTTTCCPCGCSSGCGLVLWHLDVPKDIARFTLIK